jgi:nitroimidazol reductase NimA-like FMN-containing flavoprotein (pyridoxamine 5'-phosphate oxidase superfamily)
MSKPSTGVSRLSDRQSTDRDKLDALLDATVLATIAFVRDGHPVALPTGFARIGDDVVIHGSTGSPWMRLLAERVPAAVSVTALDGVLVARSGFESSFHYRSAVVFGTFSVVDGSDKNALLETLTDRFIPGRVAEIRPSTAKELAATLVLRLPIGADNWSLKIADGWPEDPDEDVAAGGWAGVVPMTVSYGQPLRAPGCDSSTPVPPSVRAMVNGSAGPVGESQE